MHLPRERCNLVAYKRGVSALQADSIYFIISETNTNIKASIHLMPFLKSHTIIHLWPPGSNTRGLRALTEPLDLVSETPVYHRHIQKPKDRKSTNTKSQGSVKQRSEVTAECTRAGPAQRCPQELQEDKAERRGSHL